MPSDIISTLFQLIRDNWNPANTESITPTFGTGYLDPQESVSYQVQIRNIPSEDALGSSGVHGINPNGTVNQLLRGLAFVECIAEDRDGTIDPDKATDLFVREVQRIIQANINSVAGYDYVSFLGYNRAPPFQGERPLKIVRSCRIGFQWRNA